MIYILHLALFSAHSSFRLDLRSFWLFMFTWTRKRAFVSWRTGIYVFFPGVYAYFPGKYAHIFGFKMHKVEKMPQVVQLRSCEEKPLKKQKSRKWAFIWVFSRILVFVFSRFKACLLQRCSAHTRTQNHIWTIGS